MKILFIAIIPLLFMTAQAEAQDLFFIGERSFACTEGNALKANNKSAGENEDLIVRFAKDSEKAYFIVNVETLLSSRFSGKLIIYLDDGTVVTSSNLVEDEYVDSTARAVYSLADEQIESLRASNINTVRYTLTVVKVQEVHHSASNGIGSSQKNFPELVDIFF